MANSFSFDELMSGTVQNALDALDIEQRKLREFHAEMAEASTTVRSKDRMLSATFDGRGELRKLKFENAKYREMAPAELADAITKVLTDGRSQALGKMAKLPGAPEIPGVDLAEMASGKIDFETMMATVLGPMFGGKSAAKAEPENPAKD